MSSSSLKPRSSSSNLATAANASANGSSPAAANAAPAASGVAAPPPPPHEEEKKHHVHKSHSKKSLKDSSHHDQVAKDADESVVTAWRSREQLEKDKLKLEGELQELRHRVKHERSKLDQLKTSITDVSKQQQVTLSVGGRRFTTTRETLCVEPESGLANTFNEAGFASLPRDDNNVIFIDRDGTTFGHILEYLRSGHLSDDLTERERKKLLKEAEFYHLPGLISLIKQTSFSPALTANTLIKLINSEAAKIKSDEGLNEGEIGDVTLNLSGLDLRHAFWPGLQLPNWTNISHCNLRGTHLSGCSFYRLLMRGTDFEGAVMHHINLSDAHGERADFDGADLTRAYLQKGYFEGATFRGATVTGADFTYASLRYTDFTDVLLSSAKSIYNADFTGAKICVSMVTSQQYKELSHQQVEWVKESK